MRPRKFRGGLVSAALLSLGLIPLPASAGSNDVRLTEWISSVDYRLPMAAEGLPADAPRDGILITVDTEENILYLFKDGQLIRKDRAATGMDKVLTKGKRTFVFRTPRGIMRVLNKIVDPIWTKPDWAFLEKGETPPSWNSPKRKERGTLGKYALDLGDGILIHGTNDPKSLGKKASHGCIRLGDAMIKVVYQHAPVGTPVYVY